MTDTLLSMKKEAHNMLIIYDLDVISDYIAMA